MNSLQRRCCIILFCSVAMFIFYLSRVRRDVTHMTANKEATDSNDDNALSDILSLESPTQDKPVVLDDEANNDDKADDDDDDDNGSFWQLLDSDDNDNNGLKIGHVSDKPDDDRLPRHAGSVSAVRQHPSNIPSAVSYNSTPSSLIASSSLTQSQQQQLNHVIIAEKRRLAEAKQRLQSHKLRFDKELNVIMEEMKRGGVVEVHRKPIPPLSKLHNVDSRQWEGLNTSFLHALYPGIILLNDYVMAELLVSNDSTQAAGMQGQPQTIDDLTDGQIEERFYHINFDFTFDDAMAAAFGCTVKCFDPSMTVADHLRSAKVHFYQLGLGTQNTVTDRSWKLMTLRSIQSKLGHTKTVIDVLKIDIDYAEWSCLRQMLADSSLQLVKQLIFEIHTAEVLTVGHPTSRHEFIDMYETLAALERAGFRRYHYHFNPMGTYTSVEPQRC